jgi:hypothetical protein
VRRLLWFASGAAGAAAVLVASPELYTRLREAVAGGPMGYDDDVWADDEADEPIAFAPDDTAEMRAAPRPPADGEADALRSKIGEGRERLRRKAVAATPDLDDGGVGESGEGAERESESESSEPLPGPDE